MLNTTKKYFEIFSFIKKEKLNDCDINVIESNNYNELLLLNNNVSNNNIKFNDSLNNMIYSETNSNNICNRLTKNDLNIVVTASKCALNSMTFSKSEDVENGNFSDDGDDSERIGNSGQNLQIVSVQLRSEKNPMQAAWSIIINIVLPFVNGVVNSTRRLREIKNVRVINAIPNLRSSREVFTNVLAYVANTISMSLSSVQVVNKINLFYKTKINNVDILSSSSTNSDLPTIHTYSHLPGFECISDSNEIPEKSVSLKILAEPPPGTPIRADVIFIHGLHGSLVRTWKQGQWKSEGRHVKFNRPPKPEIRPPKRPRYTHSNHLRPPPHHFKRPRIEKFDKYFGEDDKFFGINLSEILNENDDLESEIYFMENESGDENILYFGDENNNFGYENDMEFSYPAFKTQTNKDVDDDTEEPTENTQNTTDFKNNNEEWSSCWPADWLPLDCPGVRVIALNYTTDQLWSPIWTKKRNRTTLAERAHEMINLLMEKDVGVGHPIVWVGHSKGGVYIKQIIVNAWESGRLSKSSIFKSTKGILFYSVPHRGSHLADINLPFLKRSVELLEIRKNNPIILDLHRRFVALYRAGHLKVRLFSFIETGMTFMSILYVKVVGADSADPGIGEVYGVQLDHREVCKPRNRTCKMYTELTNMINKVS